MCAILLPSKGMLRNTISRERSRLAAIALFAGFCALLCLQAGCSRQLAQKQRGRKGTSGPAPVSVAAATETNVPFQLHAIGHVVPFKMVAVQSRVDGTLDKVHFKDGG